MQSKATRTVSLLKSNNSYDKGSINKIVPIAKMKVKKLINLFFSLKKINCSIVLPSQKIEIPIRKTFPSLVSINP
jgi:hypothetical protein